jgi:hypothetical protein
MSDENVIQQPAASAAPAPESAPAASQPTPRAGVGIMAVAIIAVLASGISVVTYHLVMAPRLTRLAVVDLPAVYREKEAAFEHALTKENATQAERDAAMNMAAEFAKQLPKALDELATECGCTVLATNAVAGRYNVMDVTPSLRTKIGL